MYYSPLRYPGGKSKLYRFVKKLIEYNNFTGYEYAEPFAGGAGIAVALLLEGDVKKIIINDYSKSIYCFWDAVVNRTEELCKLINDTPVTIDVWHQQKNVLRLNEISLELGFAAFFLNRTNRSGILNGGVIGGIEQKGIWKIDARYNKKALIEKICKIAEKREQILVTNLECFSFLEYIKNVECLQTEKTLIYFDPPYVVNGKRLYENYYKISDHKLLAKKLINEVAYPWFLTYDKSEIIKELYSGLTTSSFIIDYSANIHRKGMELLICSNKIELPTQAMLNDENIEMFYC